MSPQRWRLWIFSTLVALLWTSSVAAEGSVYVTKKTFPPPEGKVTWSHPLVSKDYVILAVDNGDTYGLDITTGLVRWKHEGKGIPLERVIWQDVDGGRMLTVGADIVLIDPKTGKEVVTYPLNCTADGSCTSTVHATSADDLLLTGFGAKPHTSMALVKTDTLTERWPSWAFVPPLMDAIIGETRLYALSKETAVTVTSIDKKMGRVKWTATIPQIVATEPIAMQTGTTFVGVGGTYEKMLDNPFLWLIADKDGTIATKKAFTADLDGWVLSPQDVLMTWTPKLVQLEDLSGAKAKEVINGKVIGAPLFVGARYLVPITSEAGPQVACWSADAWAWETPLLLPPGAMSVSLEAKKGALYARTDKGVVVYDVASWTAIAYVATEGTVPQVAFDEGLATSATDAGVILYQARTETQIKADIDSLAQAGDNDALEAYLMSLEPAVAVMPSVKDVLGAMVGYRILQATAAFDKKDYAAGLDVLVTITNPDKMGMATMPLVLAGLHDLIGEYLYSMKKLDEVETIQLQTIVEQLLAFAKVSKAAGSCYDLCLAALQRMAKVVDKHEGKAAAAELMGQLYALEPMPTYRITMSMLAKGVVDELSEKRKKAAELLDDEITSGAEGVIKQIVEMDGFMLLEGDTSGVLLKVAAFKDLLGDELVEELEAALETLEAMEKATKKALGSGQSKAECLTECEVAFEACPRPCLVEGHCDKALKTCKKSCTSKRKPKWPKPKFTIPLGSDEWFTTCK